jgi:glutamate--cysteine ligase
MPQIRRTLSTAAMRALSDALFAAPPEDLFGLELEWPVHRHGDVSLRPTAAEAGALEQLVLPAGGRVSFEPGGQVELSTAPADSVVEAMRAARVETEALLAHMDAAGFACETIALDDRRPPHRILAKQRYQAMEGFFTEQGPAGVWMMTNTASTQINLSHDAGDTAMRWNLLTRIAPLLIAAFANSPGLDSQGQHWVSLRQAIWWSIDPSRTRPVPHAESPAEAWLEYALRAEVMFISDEGSHGATGTAVPPGLPFGQWMAEGHPLGWPTFEDFRYHLSTLFPPIRPRGWLELRVLDALPDWIRDVAALTVATACTRPASRDIHDQVPDTSHAWLLATRDGLGDPVIAAATSALFEIVAEHLPLVTTDPVHARSLARFKADYVDQRRTPGDDLPRLLDMRQHAPVAVPAGV